MKLEDQVCSLELAKRLKELGVKQDSLFFYIKFPPTEKLKNTDLNIWEKHLVDKWTIYYKKVFDYNPEINISAFTVAELWRCFPVYICDYFLTIKMYKDNLFYVSYSNDVENLKSIAFVTENGADALARMLIYLLENNYIKVEDIDE